MHENTLQRDPYFGFYWWHRWKNGAAAMVPTFMSKYRAWHPTQQRPRDGTLVRHKSGGLRKLA